MASRDTHGKPASMFAASSRSSRYRDLFSSCRASILSTQREDMEAPVHAAENSMTFSPPPSPSHASPFPQKPLSRAEIRNRFDSERRERPRKLSALELLCVRNYGIRLVLSRRREDAREGNVRKENSLTNCVHARLRDIYAPE